MTNKSELVVGFILGLISGIIGLLIFTKKNIELELAIGFILGLVLGIIGIIISIFLSFKYLKIVFISFLILILSVISILIYSFFFTKNIKLTELATGFILGLFPGIIDFFIFTKKIELKSATGFILGLVLGIVGIIISIFLGFKFKYFRATLLGFLIQTILIILVVFYGIIHY